MEYMPHIHLVIFGLVAFVPEWRRTCLIIVLFAILNIAYQPLVDIAADEGNQIIHLIYALADFITILALLKWGSKGRLLQASILTAFIAVNFALLLDYKFPPYPVYEVYPQVIFALNIIQLFLISGGIYAVAGNTIKFIMDRVYRPVLGRVWRNNDGGDDIGSGRVRNSDSIQ